jgi:Protein of unknown function (DUF4435)
MKHVLAWPEKALRAIPVFFRRWNDIDIYIEDTRKHTQHIYCELINKVGNGRFCVAKVFPLGHRNAVLTACKGDQKKGGRHRLYIIDGDLDLLTGESIPSLRRLYRHDVYCIENYLIDESAAVEVLYDEMADVEKPEIKKRLDFPQWEQQVECVAELFVMFALQRLFTPTKASISVGFPKIVSNTKPPSLNAKSVERLIAEIYTDLTTHHGADAVMKNLIMVHNRLAKHQPPSIVVSAKDYLVKLFRWYLAKQTKISATAKSLELRLAKACDIGKHKRFVAALEQASRTR